MRKLGTVSLILSLGSLASFTIAAFIANANNQGGQGSSVVHMLTLLFMVFACVGWLAGLGAFPTGIASLVRRERGRAPAVTGIIIGSICLLMTVVGLLIYFFADRW